jgi:hypothetical protein
MKPKRILTIIVCVGVFKPHWVPKYTAQKLMQYRLILFKYLYILPPICPIIITQCLNALLQRPPTEKLVALSVTM